MKKTIFAISLLMAQSALADQLPKQVLGLINGCSASTVKCMTLSDQGGDFLNLTGNAKLLEQLAAHIGEEVTVKGTEGEDSFRVASFTID
jgi:hypothetical protein